jgi:hypothetical protein
MTRMRSDAERGGPAVLLADHQSRLPVVSLQGLLVKLLYSFPHLGRFRIVFDALGPTPIDVP